MAPTPFTLSSTTRSWPSAQVTTVRLTGYVDAETWPQLAACLEQALAISAGPYVAVELGPGAELTDAAARQLVRLVLDGAGHTPRLVLTGEWGSPEGAAPGRAEGRSGPRGESEVHDLRANLRTRPLIAQAQGILQERYGLRDAETAFDLLRDSSQQHNVKLRTLVSVFLSAPRPADGPLWFPGRTRAPAPELGFAPWLRRSRVPRSAFAEAVLSTALRCVRGTRGLLHIADPLIGPQLEADQGIPDALLDRLTHGPDGAARGPATDAMREGRRVGLTDGLADARLSEETRQALRAAGIGHAWYAPLLSASGESSGVITLYAPPAGPVPTETEWKALDLVVAQAGEWLDWHRRTVMLDALEQLHAQGRAHAGKPRG
ncbi:GAF and ANTAR domain-containing protein [Streptomyces sp. SID8014]|uniref:ANTAR domain-containing protein n=1 Tax=Streptomyces sp. SID8014 TaxID=2706097 RepID=UPI0013BA387A|nr:GAF and ANTAR domain-containing protein [Streptomyces sp. SID8014]